jgi:hypothetical protein
MQANCPRSDLIEWLTDPGCRPLERQRLVVTRLPDRRFDGLFSSMLLVDSNNAVFRFFRLPNPNCSFILTYRLAPILFSLLK